MLNTTTLANSKNILVVIGATGQQGGSVVNFVLQDPELSQKFTIRTLTRNPKNDSAAALAAKGVEIIEGDLDNSESLTKLMEGAHTVFGMTVSVYDGHTREREIRQGKAMADAALAAGVKYFIYSTLPRPSVTSRGMYMACDHFEGKTDVEDYIRSLSPAMKSAFFSPGSFMQNLCDPHVMMPRRLDNNTWLIAHMVPESTLLPLVDITGDTGKYVGAMLAEPDKFEGKIVCAASELLSFTEVVKIISRLSGKEVNYMEVEEEMITKWMPPAARVMLTEMMRNTSEFGYYGSESKELVAWAGANARGKITTFEEFAAREIVLLLKEMKRDMNKTLRARCATVCFSSHSYFHSHFFLFTSPSSLTVALAFSHAFLIFH